MQRWKAPPTRKSTVQKGRLQPWGAYQRFSASGSDHARKTRSRGASKSRMMRTSASVFAAARPIAFLLFLEGAEVMVEAVEALIPEPPVMFHPIGHLAEGAGAEAAGAPLGPAEAGDEPCAVQHLQVLRHGREAHLERPGDFEDRGLARGQARQDRAPGRVGEGRERGAQVLVGSHGLNHLIN